MHNRTKLSLLLLFGLLGTAVTLGMPRIPQDPAYHNFADKRIWLGIPHTLDVLSNLPLMAAGIFGFSLICRNRRDESFLMQAVLFGALALTGCGSMYYHWQPANGTLVLDRLPMAAMFMSFFAVMIADRIGLRAGQCLFWPLVGLGILSVLQWWWSELQGAGDLRWYLLVQFLPMALLPIMVTVFPPRFTHNQDVWPVMYWYALAMVFECYDAEIFGWNGFVSGHTLKHLCAGAAAWFMVRMLT
jgi:hypothetical protein